MLDLSSRPHAVSHLTRSLTVPLILLLAALLRFYQLSGQSLWADEGNSVAMARRSFVEIARRTAFDIHPPLYYWLLKIWISIFGDSEIGLRSLSVVLGIGLVYLIGVLGTRLFSSRVGLIAAFIAAFSPLQVYYSQETRMYMLLTVLSGLTVLTTNFILKDFLAGKTRPHLVGAVYAFTTTAGLYTHYAYPLILLAVNLVVLIWFWHNWRNQNSQFSILNSKLFSWLILQLIPMLLYLPWLPIAWRQVTIWPSEEQVDPLPVILGRISTTLLFGLSWPFNSSLVITSGLGLALCVALWLSFKKLWQSERTTRKAQQPPLPRTGTQIYETLMLLWLWFLLPVLLTIVIFSPAFLKFLLVATPPLAILLALVIDRLTASLSIRNERPILAANASGPSWLGYLGGGAVLVILTALSAVSLYHYYNNPTFARDNYRGMANFIKAIGKPDDAVILNAEGQQDVFNYYYERETSPVAAVYPLPRRRPLVEEATLNELQEIAANANRVFAAFWASQQADPRGVIENWLDSHLFKATDRWYGNVRLVSYASPKINANLPPNPVDFHLGQHIRLTGYSLSATQVTPGDILQVALSWESDNPLTEDYTVFLQLLDQANHLVGQTDAKPLTPTYSWPVGEAVIDAHGIYIEPGTPPGKLHLILGLYDSSTGQRLPITSDDVANGDRSRDYIELAEVEIIRPANPLPLEAYNIQVSLSIPMLDVTLVGYDLYKVGHRSKPDTPLHPGDALHLVAYWSPRWPVQRLEDQLLIQVIKSNGTSTRVSVTRHPSGTDYSIKDWQPGEIIRAQYDLFLNNLEPGTYRLALTLGISRISKQQITAAVTKPFRVE